MTERKTDAELIAEAIAAGRVRIIPRGVSGLGAGDSGQKWRKQPGLPKRLREKYSRRRGEIREMLDAGWSVELVAERMGVQVQRIRQVMRDLGMKIPLARRKARVARHCRKCGKPIRATAALCAGCRREEG